MIKFSSSVSTCLPNSSSTAKGEP